MGPRHVFGDMETKTFSSMHLRRRIRAKPLNYSKLSTISQQPDKNPSAFLERLREALIKHTSLLPDTLEGELILTDKFVTQATSDIRRKLQKLAIGPEAPLDHLLKVTNTIFYNRGQDKEKKLKKKTEKLVVALRMATPQDTQGPKSNCHHCRQPGHWRRDCLQCPAVKGDPRDPVPSAR